MKAQLIKQLEGVFFWSLAPEDMERWTQFEIVDSLEFASVLNIVNACCEGAKGLRVFSIENSEMIRIPICLDRGNRPSLTHYTFIGLVHKGTINMLAFVEGDFRKENLGKYRKWERKLTDCFTNVKKMYLFEKEQRELLRRLSNKV